MTETVPNALPEVSREEWDFTFKQSLDLITAPREIRWGGGVFRPADEIAVDDVIERLSYEVEEQKGLKRNVVTDILDLLGSKGYSEGIRQIQELLDRLTAEPAKTEEELKNNLSGKVGDEVFRRLEEEGLVDLPNLYLALQAAGVRLVQAAYLRELAEREGLPRREIYTEIDFGTGKREKISLEGTFEKIFGGRGFTVVKGEDGGNILLGYGEFLSGLGEVLREGYTERLGGRKGLGDYLSTVGIELSDDKLRIIQEVWNSYENNEEISQKERLERLGKLLEILTEERRNVEGREVVTNKVDEIFGAKTPERSVMQDLRLAQAYINAVLPPDVRLKLAELELNKDPRLISERRKVYKAFLMAFNVKPTQGEVKIGDEEREEVLKLASRIRDRLYQEREGGRVLARMNLKEANRVALEEQLRALGAEVNISDEVWNNLEEELLKGKKSVEDVIKGLTGKDINLESISEEDKKKLAEYILAERLRTIKALGRVERKYDLKIENLGGLTSVANLGMALKGIEFLYRRSLLELPEWLKDVKLKRLVFEQLRRGDEDKVEKQLRGLLQKLAEKKEGGEGSEGKSGENKSGKTVLEEKAAEESDAEEKEMKKLKEELEKLQKEYEEVDRIWQTQSEERRKVRKSLRELREEINALAQQIYMRAVGEGALRNVVNLTSKDNTTAIIYESRTGKKINLLDEQEGLVGFEFEFKWKRSRESGKSREKRSTFYLPREAILFSPKLAKELMRLLEIEKELMRHQVLELDRKRRKLRARIRRLGKRVGGLQLESVSVEEKEKPSLSVLSDSSSNALPKPQEEEFYPLVRVERRGFREIYEEAEKAAEVEELKKRQPSPRALPKPEEIDASVQEERREGGSHGLLESEAEISAGFTEQPEGEQEVTKKSERFARWRKILSRAKVLGRRGVEKGKELGKRIIREVKGGFSSLIVERTKRGGEAKERRQVVGSVRFEGEGENRRAIVEFRKGRGRNELLIFAPDVNALKRHDLTGNSVVIDEQIIGSLASVLSNSGVKFDENGVIILGVVDGKLRGITLYTDEGARVINDEGIIKSLEGKIQIKPLESRA